MRRIRLILAVAMVGSFFAAFAACGDGGTRDDITPEDAAAYDTESATDADSDSDSDSDVDAGDAG